MNERIEPHKVTKPIQLLAAWLLGLILIDGSFLSAAALLKQPQWMPAVLVIAAVVNVPLFLVSLFLLQTRFRPEMQEDSYYSKYLEVQKATGKPESLAGDIQVLRSTVSESNARTVEVIEQLQTQVVEIATQISTVLVLREPEMELITSALETTRENIQVRKREIRWQAFRVAVNDLLPAYSDVIIRLAEAGIPVDDTFGSTSEDPFPPEYYVLAFGDDVTIEALQELLETIVETGVEYLDYSANEMSEGRLYVGSYAYDESPVLKLDESMVSRVLGCTSTREIKALMADYPTTLTSERRKRSR